MTTFEYFCRFSIVMTKRNKLGQRIKAFRLERDMTQAQAAAFLGVSKPTVVRLELGTGNVMDLTRAKIERQLDKAQLVITSVSAVA